MTGPTTPDSTQAETLLLAAGDVAELLAVSRLTIFRWRAAGRLPPPLKIGRVVRWRRLEIETWLAAGCPTCRPAPRR